MNEILSFSIDHYKILEEDNLITLIQLKPVITGSNRHNTYFSLETIKNAEPTLYNKPVICIWNKTDFVEHARTAKQKEMQDCVGCIPETNNSELIEEDGKTAQYINAAIWKHYFPNVALKLKNNETTKISMEISVEKSHKRDDGLIEIDEYKYVGFTLLGENMLEAIPGANAKIIKYSTTDYSEMVDNTNKQLSLYTIPDTIKENAKKALELYQNNLQFIDFAKEIIDNNYLSYSKIDGILNEIQSLKKEDSIMFFGGIESKEWCENIVNNKIIIETNNEQGLTGETINHIENNNQLSFSFENEQEKEDDDVQKESVEKVQLKFGLNSSQIREILNNALSHYKYKSGDYEWNRYYVEAYDEEFVYVWDEEDSRNKSITYNISDNIANVDISSAQEVISAGYMPVGSKESDINTNAVEGDTTDYKAKFEEMSVKYEEMSAKYADMEKEKDEIATNYSVLESDIESLKQFKADTEKTNLKNKANELYSKYESYITEEEKAELNVKLFSVENFDIFKEKVFAIVAPKMEAENIALKQNNNDVDPNKIQFSTMPLLDTINKDENKSSFEKLKEYANS